jgi:ribosomal protein S27AE
MPQVLKGEHRGTYLLDLTGSWNVSISEALGGEEMVRGPHGHEKTGIEVLRVLCPKCSNRVMIEPGENQAKCSKCGTVVKRPSKQK